MYIYSNKCYEFILLKETCIILYMEKPNGYQYSLVTIHSFCFIITNATLFHPMLSESKYKRNFYNLN